MHDEWLSWLLQLRNWSITEKNKSGEVHVGSAVAGAMGTTAPSQIKYLWREEH